MGLLPLRTSAQNVAVYEEYVELQKRRAALLAARSQGVSEGKSTASSSSNSEGSTASALSKIPAAKLDSMDKTNGSSKNLVLDGESKKILDGIAKAFRSR